MAVDKLIDSAQLDTDLTSVADAIRAKGGTSEKLEFPSEFIVAINAIQSGESSVVVNDTPDGNGGTIRTITATNVTTLVEKTITENGTYDPSDDDADGYNSVTVNVSGGEPVVKKQINFIDYDGTILHSYTSAEWASVTALPSNPSHTGLTAQGWNWTKAQIDAQLTAIPDGDILVGQMYVTSDGKTRLYIHLESGRLHPYLGICPNGTVVVDWGDGSATSTLTGTSLATVKTADHTYARSGDYVITLTVSSGSFAFYGVSNTSYILRKGSVETANVNFVYSNALQKIELGTGANIGNYAFQYCSSLASVTIPSNVTSIGNYAFQYCYSLLSVTIPSGIASVGNSWFRQCYSLLFVSIPSEITAVDYYGFSSCSSLVSVTLPSSVTSIGDYAFDNNYALKSVIIPSNVTSINKNVFYNCRSLASLIIQNGITSISASMFNSCYSLSSITIPSSVTNLDANSFGSNFGVSEYHFLRTTPPTLANTNVFSNIQSDCIIYVPKSENQTVLNAYKTATNWSTYASYMREEP